MARNEADFLEYEYIDDDSTPASTKEYLAFYSDGLCFAVPAQNISTIIMSFEITKLPKLPAYIPGVINLRGQIVPIIDIRLKMNRPAMDYNRNACIIVLDFDDLMIGMLVEQVAHVVDITEFDIKPSSTIEQQEMVSGIAKVGENVYLLLDCEKLLQ